MYTDEIMTVERERQRKVKLDDRQMIKKVDDMWNMIERRENEKQKME